MAFARTVVEGHVAAHVIDNEIKRYPRLPDIYEGVKWRLAREPDIGYRAERSNPDTYVIHSYHWNAGFAVTVAYHFNSEQVEILDVRVVPATRE